MNAPTSPIGVTPLALLTAFAEMLADMIAEAEQAGESTVLLKVTAKVVAIIIDQRGVGAAAQFAARISGLDVVDVPQAVTS